MYYVLPERQIETDMRPNSKGENRVTAHPEYVVDEQQPRKAVLLPVAEWEQIISELEELDDIRACDAAQPHAADRLPFEQAVREIQQDFEA